ncbi:Rossmann-fold NAD(P)-binding domain-containing protein [Oleomonas cavernae]|uniref:hypothetical protein n=1 Tax=Oleomonas cavernae TaxID=2320859 RepID=UPI001F1C8C0E|nr:hypothetical protein [Oleomonas cavernae]
MVEPGFFRTDFLDGQSLSVAEPIADYAETVGVTRDLAGRYNHAQPGDPARLAKAMIILVNAEQPPARLPLGSDTVARITAKNDHVAAEMAAWRDLAVSTDGAW